MSDLWWLISPAVEFGLDGVGIFLFIFCWLQTREKEEKPVPKTPWEDRVKMLLTKPEIVWYYKAPDGKMYGGQPRIDFVASDIFGRFIMIEVKSLPDASKSFIPKALVPPVQQDALDRIAGTASGAAILAVGHESVLRLYSWGKIRGLTKVSVDRDGAEIPFWSATWNGPTNWAPHNLHVILVKNWHSEPGPYTGLGPLETVVKTVKRLQSHPALTDPPPEITSPLILPPGMESRRIAPTQASLEAMLSAIGACVPTLEPIQNPVVKRAKPVPPAPPPEKTSGEKRKEILKKANRQHHARQ